MSQAGEQACSHKEAWAHLDFYLWIDARLVLVVLHDVGIRQQKYGAGGLRIENRVSRVRVAERRVVAIGHKDAAKESGDPRDLL